MNVLDEWARTWSISEPAMADLRARFGALTAYAPKAAEGPASSEAAVQVRIRLEASRKGLRLWRNNVGAGYAEDGTFMRWGLANDSAAVNSVLKSGDLIGIRPRLIGPADVGSLIGQFVTREVKHAGWKYRGTPREIAQQNWIGLVASFGGDAGFATGEGSL